MLPVSYHDMTQRVSFIIRLILALDLIRKMAGGWHQYNNVQKSDRLSGKEWQVVRVQERTILSHKYVLRCSLRNYFSVNVEGGRNDVIKELRLNFPYSIWRGQKLHSLSDVISDCPLTRHHFFSFSFFRAWQWWCWLHCCWRWHCCSGCCWHWHWFRSSCCCCYSRCCSHSQLKASFNIRGLRFNKLFYNSFLF